MTCGDEVDEKPPPALRTLNELYEDFGLIDDDHAPYKDVETAEYERKLNELREEVSDYQDEIKSLEKANKELRDSVNNNDESLVKSDNESPSSEGRSLGEFEATAYTSNCDGCSGITASGEDVRSTIYTEDGLRIFAAPKSIPFNTILKVTNQHGESIKGVVLDRGGAITEGKLDVLVDSKTEAYSFGRQRVKVEDVSP